MTYYYSSEATPDEIIKFYEQHGNCDLGSQSAFALRRLCGGTTSHSGEYLAYIPIHAEKAGETAYIVEVRWHGCTWDIE